MHQKKVSILLSLSITLVTLISTEASFSDNSSKITLSNNNAVAHKELSLSEEYFYELLSSAIQKDDNQAITQLLEQNLPLNGSRCFIAEALNKNNIPLALTLIEKGAPVSAKALNSAIENGNVFMVKKLLELGVAASQESLIIALYVNQKEIVEELIKHGASPSPEMLPIALEQLNLPMVTKLLNYGVVPSNSTFFAALYPVKCYLNNVVKLLLAHNTPSNGLFVATTLIDDIIVELLLAGEDPYTLSVNVNWVLQALASRITSGKGEIIKKTLLSLIIGRQEAPFSSLVKELLQNLTIDERKDITKAILDKLKSIDDDKSTYYRAIKDSWENLFTKELNN